MDKWGYGGDNGPSMWHVVEGCAYPIAVEGNRQSPIDVQTNRWKYVKNLEN